ncbi:alpha-galactosidase [Dysgonomonas sp. Marseille-P4677]|uniref:alpha-galactosidase n=1 Tax=Dysgonomonas sp. Marseille-P4677 TaxID=2364790 RepID=UPI00191486D2|nr:alpha-galactosidase [Dysgonomonas sp. Marseille-P4677]MBK5719611.1 alpha-galactosidase [Dysgonomonas sp. Marseille-P4677]
MKKIFVLIIAIFGIITIKAEPITIKISTNETDLVLQTADNGRLFQLYLGEKLKKTEEYSNVSLRSQTNGMSWEVYPVSGSDTYFEPAFAIQHNDGNLTTILKYVSHSREQIDSNVDLTTIILKDELYPVEVKLFYKAFHDENIIKSWTEIKHQEKKAVTLNQFASSMLYLRNSSYHLTEYAGDWAKEVRESSIDLNFGKKIIDTKLGARANMFTPPFFTLGLDQNAKENEGTVLMGTLSWTGNFRFTFEVDNLNNLRVISGINPDASHYQLEPNEVFKTPEFVFTLSQKGKGQGSRNIQKWARKYQLKDGQKGRMTLLNNWEATYFDFDEPKLTALMQEAKDLGVDMFLLDDGWFANKYPRNSDTQGLGDWDVNMKKLPNGVHNLVDVANKTGVKFGIWIEPEMISPKSELFDKHPDWVIMLPNREPYYFRNQLVLDLSNPKVQDYVFNIIDKLMTENPDIAYFKWDCNSPITNIYSPYLKSKQNNLYIEYVKSLYSVLDRIKAKYPDLPMMLCSGGGGRSDYNALQYFTEFWCSDNTDPIERIFIQWGYSHFFPAKAMAAHVTSWNKNTSVKFRVDVAMMCKMGFDINIKELGENDQIFCKNAVQNYNKIKKVVFDGDLYRLISPYENNHASVMYVNGEKNKAVVYAYDIYPRYGEDLFPVKLQGLDNNKMYKVKEINLMPNQKSQLPCNENLYSGDYLMKIGLDILSTNRLTSRIIEIEAVN